MFLVLMIVFLLCETLKTKLKKKYSILLIIRSSRKVLIKIVQSEIKLKRFDVHSQNYPVSMHSICAWIIRNH